MRGIPEATVVILMAEERAELEGLARSTKTEHRLRLRARIVLLAADGVASRAIGRAVGCTTGTASKWRVRLAEWQQAGPGGLRAPPSFAIVRRILRRCGFLSGGKESLRRRTPFSVLLQLGDVAQEPSARAAAERHLSRVAAPKMYRV